MLTKFFEMNFNVYTTGQIKLIGHLVHVPNFGVVAGSEDFACATLPTTPLDFQGKIKNFCHPTLLKIRFKMTVTPPPPFRKWAKSKLRFFNKL